MRAEHRTQAPNSTSLLATESLSREFRSDAKLAKVLGVLAIPSAVVAFAAGSPIYGLIGLALSVPLLSPKSCEYVTQRIDMRRFAKEVKS